MGSAVYFSKSVLTENLDKKKNRRLFFSRVLYSVDKRTTVCEHCDETVVVVGSFFFFLVVLVVEGGTPFYP